MFLFCYIIVCWFVLVNFQLKFSLFLSEFDTPILCADSAKACLNGLHIGLNGSSNTFK